MKKKKNSLFADVLRTITRYFLVLVAAVVIMIAVSGVRVVKSGEVALILRFGKLVGNTDLFEKILAYFRQMCYYLKRICEKP